LRSHEGVAAEQVILFRGLEEKRKGPVIDLLKRGDRRLRIGDHFREDRDEVSEFGQFAEFGLGRFEGRGHWETA